MAAQDDSDGTAPGADLDALLRDADPLATSAGRAQAWRSPVHDIREAVMTDDESPVHSERRTAGWVRRRVGTGPRRLGPAMAVAAAVVAVAAAATVAVELGVDGRDVRAGAARAGAPPADPLVSASASPSVSPSVGPSVAASLPSSPEPVAEPSGQPGGYYLLGQEWQVVRVDEYGDESAPAGEMTLVRADESVELFWRPAETHDTYLEDRRASSAEERQVAVDGAVADLIRYDTPAGSTLDLTALWLLGDRSYEFRGTATSIDDFEQTLTGLVRVDAATWAAALPEGAVTPAERAQVVAAMLEGVPLPPGTTVGDVVVATGVRDEYQVGAAVMGSVACGWISSWVSAVASGDAPAAEQAVDAMGTSRDWSTLQRMDEAGDFSEVVWSYADAVAGTGTVPGGSDDLTVEDTYQDALGC